MKNAFQPSLRSISATYQIPSAHWDAMADILGETETEKLYGERPVEANSAAYCERLYFDQRAPRRSVWVAVALALVMAGSVAYGAIHHRDTRAVELEPCALVLTESEGPVCR